MAVKLYNLGLISWVDSQTVYHALARLGRPSLVLCRPKEPYVSVGFSQNPAVTLDLDHCRQADLPVFRREVGGGAVLLDSDQVFYQLILPADHRLIGPNRIKFYQTCLGPVIEACVDLGVTAQFRQPCDLVAAGRKITGAGAGEIGPSAAFVGNLLLDFDHRAMARTLNCPDELFRARVERAMTDQMTTLKDEAGSAVEPDDLAALLAAKFSDLLGPLEEAVIDPELRQEMDRQQERLLDPVRLHRRGRRYPWPRVKIRAGLYVHHHLLDSAQGPIALLALVKDMIAVDLEINGPLSPAGEKSLRAALLNRSHPTDPVWQEIVAGRFRFDQ